MSVKKLNPEVAAKYQLQDGIEVGTHHVPAVNKTVDLEHISMEDADLIAATGIMFKKVGGSTGSPTKKKEDK